MNQTNDSKRFWTNKEQEIGSKILAKSYARLIGKTNSGLLNKNGLLYCTADNFYFEDFEKSSMLDFLITSNTDFEKFSIHFPISETIQMRKVSESSAIACIKNERKVAKPIHKIGSFLQSVAWEIVFKSGPSYYFDLLNPNTFIKLITNN